DVASYFESHAMLALSPLLPRLARLARHYDAHRVQTPVAIIHSRPPHPPRYLPRRLCSSMTLRPSRSLLGKFLTGYGLVLIIRTSPVEVRVRELQSNTGRGKLQGCTLIRCSAAEARGCVLVSRSTVTFCIGDCSTSAATPTTPSDALPRPTIC